MAETYDEAKEALSAFARTEWAVALAAASLPSTTPLAYNNLSFTPPKDGSTWGRLHIQHNDADRASIGPRARFRRWGQLFVQIFTPIGGGTQVADQIANSLVKAFEDAGAVDNIWFRNTKAREVGPDGTMFQVNFETSFTFDRIS